MTSKRISRDLSLAMVDTERDWFALFIKDHKYIDANPYLESRNHGYWLPYMYFIILEGANIPTNKFVRPATVALTHL